MKRVLVLTLAVLSVAVAVRAEPGVSDDEVRIGVCTSFEGLNKTTSEQQTTGANAYIDYVNKELKGVHGRRIKLLFQNDAFDPVQTVDCFNALVSTGMFAQAFVNGAPTAAKYIQLSEANHVPLVGFNSGAPFLFDPFRKYTFPTRSSFDDEANELVAHVKQMGIKKVGVIYQNDAFGANCLQALAAAFQKNGLELSGASGIERNSVDVGAAVEAVRASAPDVVIMAGNPVPEAAVLKLAQQTNWTPQFVVMVGREYVAELAGQAAEGVILSQDFPPVTEQSIPAVALYNKIMERYQPEARRNLTSLDGFVQAMVLVEGLKRAGKDLTRDKFVAALETMRGWDPGFGDDYFKINYSKDKHDVSTTYSDVIDHGGKLTLLKDWTQLKKQTQP